MCASVLIWHDHLSVLQMFGYSIALGGLVYYKLGADKLRESYTKLRTDGTIAWQRFGNTYPALRKVTVIGAAILFILLSLGTLYGGKDTSTGYSGTRLTDSSAMLPGIFPDSTPDMNYKPPRKLDIVISMDTEIPSKVGFGVKQIKELSAFAGLEPSVWIYFKDPKSNELNIQQQTGATIVKKTGIAGGDDETYLSHIVDKWDDLAEHTVFLNAGFKDIATVEGRIEDYFKPNTGVLSLSSGYRTCVCGSCKDPWGGKENLGRIPEIFAAVYSEICPSSNVLLSNSGQFIVSAKRIRGTPKHAYEHLRALLESDKKHWIHKEAKGIDEIDRPSFGRVIEKSWMIAFKCASPRLAETCPTLSDRRRAADSDERCQCID